MHDCIKVWTLLKYLDEVDKMVISEECIHMSQVSISMIPAHEDAIWQSFAMLIHCLKACVEAPDEI